MPEKTDAPAVEPEQPTIDAPAMPGADVTATEIVRRVEPTALTRATRAAILSDDELRRTWRTAAALAQSGMWSLENGSKITPEMAFAKILVGRDLGLSATRALMSIDLVRGAIQMRGVLLASFVRESANYHYKTKDHTDKACTVVLLGFPQDEPEDGFVRARGQWWEVLGEEKYTIEDAQRQKLVKTGSAWETVPRNMLLWRAISNAVKFHAPDLLGGVPVYVEGEIPREPELTAGVGDGSTPGIDLGPKVEAVLKRAAELEHAGLADRATAEMALGGQPPSVVERWVTEANAELDKLVADSVIIEADVVDEPVVHELYPPKGKVAACSCGWSTPTCASNEQALEAGQAHVEKATAEAEPEVLAADPVEATNRAEVLREQAIELRAEAEAHTDEDHARSLAEQADALEVEADAIADVAQTDLGL